MINCKNYCILKAYGVDDDQLEKCNALKKTGVQIKIENSFLDYRFLVINDSASEVEFNEVVLGLVKVLGENLYSDNDESLEQVVVNMLRNDGKTVSVAESFTGGMISSRFVNVSGCSSVFYEGLVTYGSSAKIRRLHVKVQTLENYGVVSKEIANEMTQGLLSNRITDYAVATTGCAGPDSDEYDTPVGLCYVCIANNKFSVVAELMIDGDRNEIRNKAVNYALFLFLQILRGKYGADEIIKMKI